jgi:hypothetical protein
MALTIDGTALSASGQLLLGLETLQELPELLVPAIRRKRIVDRWVGHGFTRNQVGSSRERLFQVLAGGVQFLLLRVGAGKVVVVQPVVKARTA